MSKLITSSHHYFPVYGIDLPKKEYKWWQDLLDENTLDEGEFIFYRGSWFYLGDCMRLDKSYKELYPDIKSWDGYWDDTFFSLVVCKYNQDEDYYQMGLFFG